MGDSVSTQNEEDDIKNNVDNKDNGDNKDKDDVGGSSSSGVPEISKVEEKKRGEEEKEDKVKKVENVGDLVAGIDEMKKSGATSQRFVFNSQPYDPEGVL